MLCHVWFVLESCTSVPATVIFSGMFSGSTNSCGTTNGDIVGVGVPEHVVLHLVDRHAAHRSADDAKQLALVLVLLSSIGVPVDDRLAVADEDLRCVRDQEEARVLRPI